MLDVNVAITISKGEDILTFAGLADLFSKLQIKYYIIDISEEKGWFSKGVHYLVLDYRRPDLSVKFNMEGVKDMREEIADFLVNEEIHINLVHGSSFGALLSLSTSVDNDIISINVDAGLRFDNEDLNKIADYLSNYNFTSLPSATKLLLNEGFSPESIRLTGHPMCDTIVQVEGKAAKKSKILEELEIKKNEYVSMILYNINSMEYIDKIGAIHSDTLPIIVSTSRDVESKLRVDELYYKLMAKYDLMFIEPLDIIDLLFLLKNSRLIYTDTDHICIISSILKKPCIYLGSKYPRNELVEGGWIKTFQEGGLNRVISWEINSSALNLLGIQVAERIYDIVREITFSKRVPRPPTIPKHLRRKFDRWL